MKASLLDDIDRDLLRLLRSLTGKTTLTPSPRAWEDLVRARKVTVELAYVSPLTADGVALYRVNVVTSAPKALPQAA